MAAFPQTGPAPLRSLADAAPGDLVEVVYVLFGSLRQRYADAGIRAGTRLRFRARCPAQGVLVELPSGELVAVDAVHAPFVEVRPASAGPAWSPSGLAAVPAGPAPLPEPGPAREPAPEPRIA